MTIVEPKLPMIANKNTNTNGESIAVKNIKYDSSKTKLVDYLKRVFITLTKPVGKTHNSSFICKVKKNKKTKKNKKNKKNKKRYKTN